MTIAAYVFINCRSEALDVIAAVQAIPAVEQVHALFGPLDAIAYIAANDLDTLGQVVDQIVAIPGVQSTDTRLTRG